MKTSFWKKTDYIAGLLPLMAVFGVLVISANVEIKDLDIWLHLAMGKFITLHRMVPGTDMLSCSISGTPWINHEWLFQVILFNINNAWGPDGLIFMQVVVAAATMLLLLLLGYGKERQLITIVMLFLVYMVYQQRFTIRPDLYSLLFFTVYIFVLSLHINKRWAAPVLFVVQVLWSNMHGFFFFGPLFVLIGLVSEYIKRHVPLPCEWNDSGRLTDDEFGRMKRIFVFVLLACLFNPSFAKGAWYPVQVFFSLSGDNKIFFQYIQELKQPISWGTVFDTSHYLYYKVLIFLSFISFVFNRRRIDISALLFWLVFLFFSLKAVRNTPFFAFAAYLVFITNIINVRFEDIVPFRFVHEKFYYITTIMLKLLFVLWIGGYYDAITLRGYYDFDKYEIKSEFGGVSQRSYPDKAVDFLVRNGVKGNFFNDFNSGAYLLGKTYPDIKVFIDGRTEVYGGRFFKRYQDIWEEGNTDLFEEAVKQYNITGALLNSTRHHIPDKILNYLYRNRDWQAVYFDYDAVVFLKKTAVNDKVIRERALDLTQWKVPEQDLFKLGDIRILPYRPYYRAYTLESLGLNDAALGELRQALRVDPFYTEAHELMGKIYARKKDYRQAFEHFRIASMRSPGNKDRRHNFALSYMDLGQYAQAVKQYQAITEAWPGDPKGYFLLTKARILNKQFDEAVDALRRAHELDARDIHDLLELGDMLVEHNAYAQARAAYTLGVDTEKETADVYKKLGFVSLALKDAPRAKEEFQKALSAAPGDQEIQKALDGLR